MWLLDHFFQMPGFGTGPDDPMLECYTGLAYLAGAGASYLVVNLMPRCEIDSVRRVAHAILG